MTEAKQSRACSRAASLAFALAATALGVWALYAYGPRPSPGEEEATAAAAESPARAQPREESNGQCCQHGETQARATAGPDFLTGLYADVPSGRIEGTRAEFLDGLEKKYQLRGYKSLTDIIKESVKARRGRPKFEKFYWRYEGEGSAPAFIGANGTDADPHSDARTSEPAVFNTVVTSDGESGLRWVTFKQELKGGGASPKDKLDFDAEAPGVDPPGVPRAPGLSRRFSFGGGEGSSLVTFYTSHEPAEDLLRWYATRMPPDWQYVPVASTQARSVSEGAMCFTRGHQFCLVWVVQGSAGEPTSIIVSLKG